MTYLEIVVVLGMVWSTSPGPFDVKEKTLALVNNDPAKLVPGAFTVATAIGIAETLLNKSGGYLTNDIGPPGVYLDNIPNWEFGALRTEGLDQRLANDSRVPNLNRWRMPTSNWRNPNSIMNPIPGSCPRRSRNIGMESLF